MIRIGSLLKGTEEASLSHYYTNVIFEVISLSTDCPQGMDEDSIRGLYPCRGSLIAKVIDNPTHDARLKAIHRILPDGFILYVSPESFYNSLVEV